MDNPLIARHLRTPSSAKSALVLAANTEGNVAVVDDDVDKRHDEEGGSPHATACVSASRNASGGASNPRSLPGHDGAAAAIVSIVVVAPADDPPPTADEPDDELNHTTLAFSHPHNTACSTNARASASDSNASGAEHLTSTPSTSFPVSYTHLTLPTN